MLIRIYISFIDKYIIIWFSKWYVEKIMELYIIFFEIGYGQIIWLWRFSLLNKLNNCKCITYKGTDLRNKYKVADEFR